MKRKSHLIKGAALGAALTGVTLGLAGCAPLHRQLLYGPPPEEESRLQGETVPGAGEERTFDPADMEVEDVYGPPPEEGETETQTDPFDPADMVVEPEYGPPEDMIVGGASDME